jgi:hypothetical protein
MEFVKKYCSLVLKLVLALSLVAALTGCASGPLEPSRRELEANRRAWLKEVRSAFVSDKIYELTDKGDVLPLFINALPLDDGVMAEARKLWGTDPRFVEKTNAWLAKGRIVVLVGLYTRDLQQDDLLKNDRFRVSLRSNGGLKAPPTGKELVKFDLITDFFPLFNPWEQVLAVSFDGLWTQNHILVIDSPYGVREINLTRGAKP